MQRQPKLILTRHGERLDLVDPQWKLTAANPHNPPLSRRGEEQAHRTGVLLKDAGITRIFCSPFYRCLQTAHGIATGMGGNVTICVDDGAVEMLNMSWFPGRPAGTAAHEASKLFKHEFPLIDDTYVSHLVAKFPESLDPAAMKEGCNCGLCQNWREFSECDGTNHVNTRAATFVDHLVKTYPNETILVVGHGASMEAAYLALDPQAKHVFVTYCR